MRLTLPASYTTPTSNHVMPRQLHVLEHLPHDTLSRGVTLRRQAPATCGELIQGAIDGRDFLVNCPIDRYSRATVKMSSTPGYRIEDAQRFGKIMRALELLGGPSDGDGYDIRITSDVPRGKGMASSSADLAAVVSAVTELTGRDLCEVELTRLFARVEPSDCVHLSGVAHVDHLNGEILSRLPAPTGLGVIIVDCGGEIDTTGFDRERARAVYRAEQPAVIAMLNLLRRGLRRNDLAQISTAATQSALLSQYIIPKPHFESLLAFVTAQGALGINCAHSGTVLGVLYRIGGDVGDRLVQGIQRRFDGALEVIGTHRVIGGGCS